MKKLFIGVAIFSVIGCNDQSDDAADTTPAAPAIAQIQSIGCTVAASGNSAHISCADGSSATVATAPTYYYPKASTGTEYPGLHYIAGNQFLNTATGNIVNYDDNGIVGIVTVFYENANCSGQGYANPPDSHHFSNELFANSGGAPAGVTAFSVGKAFANVTVNSNYSNGVCTNAVLVNNWGAWNKIYAATMDSGLPNSLGSPFQLMVAQ